LLAEAVLVLVLLRQWAAAALAALLLVGSELKHLFLV
jgi:hypothetical protein